MTEDPILVESLDHVNGLEGHYVMCRGQTIPVYIPKRNKDGIPVLPKDWDECDEERTEAKTLQGRDIEITNVSFEPFITEFGSGFVIRWAGNIGFGEYTVYRREDGKWSVDSERMDDKSDHSFFDLLMKYFWENEIMEVR